jgi:hypothetical protein
MIEPPEVLVTTPQAMAALRLTIPRDRIRHEMGPGLKELHAALAAQGVLPVGPWFTHHFRTDPTVWAYQGLYTAWSDFDAWIRAQGLVATDQFSEAYLVGPESGAAPAEVRTELSRPLVEAR